MRQKTNQGQTLIEILVAVGVVAVSLTVLVAITTASVAKNREAKERVIATRMAQEAAEAMRMARDARGWGEFIDAIDTMDGDAAKTGDSVTCITDTQIAGLPPVLANLFNTELTGGSADIGVLGTLVRGCDSVETGEIYKRGAYISYDSSTPGKGSVTYRILVTWKEGSRDPYVYVDGVLKEYE